MKTIILIFIILMIIMYILLKYEEKQEKKLKYQKNIYNYTNINNELNYKQFYMPKRYIITLNELKFYTVLTEIAKELNLVVFSQVSLYNILETKANLDYKTKTIYFNKIAAKSIDFVLVDKKDCRIKLCIELDDNTHKQKKRIERDVFLNKLFKDLEINLLRQPLCNIYFKDNIKRKIEENMKNHYYVQ